MSDTTPPAEPGATEPIAADPTTSTTAPPTTTSTPPAPTTTSTTAPAARTMRVAAYGIEADLPRGWECRISRRNRPTDDAPAAAEGRSFGPAAAARAAGADSVTPDGDPSERPQPIAHLANFPLPEARGDFGSGAVDTMGSGDVLVVLFEYGPESVGQPLFRREGMPRNLKPNMFSKSALQRTLPGQAGCQVFFTENGRAFCAYVVLGRQEEAPRLVPPANATLRATRINRR